MLGAELIIFRRCLLLVMIGVGGIHSVIAQQMHAFYQSVPEFHGGNITYSSSSSTTRYRVAIDRRIDEQYLGKPVFVDARGIKYIIDSKYRKQIVE